MEKIRCHMTVQLWKMDYFDDMRQVLKELGEWVDEQEADQDEDKDEDEDQDME